MDLLIAAGVPSAITAFCFWLIERKIQARAEAEKEERLNRQREQDAKEKNREELQYMTVKALDGAHALSEATAKAMQRIPDAKCNGDMHKALDYEQEAKARSGKYPDTSGSKSYNRKLKALIGSNPHYSSLCKEITM